MASIERTAYPRFMRHMSARELHDAFTPTPEEVTWVQARTRSPQHLLALGVLLKSFQRLGYFPKLDDVPAVVVGHVRDCFELDGATLARCESERTLWRHHRFIRGTWIAGCARSNSGE